MQHIKIAKILIDKILVIFLFLNKESHWLEISATKLFEYYSDTTRLNLDNIKMRIVNYC